MDFRANRQQRTPASPAPAAAAPVQSSQSLGQPPLPASPRQTSKNSPLVRLALVILLFATTALVVTVALFLTLGGASQQRAVAKDKYQAVFLNNGQVYFGNINSIHRETLDLRNIYYLQTQSGTAASTTSTSGNVSLVKLGCELHAPYDRMLINDSQVIFWENIKDDSQVVKAIAQYKKSGQQNCSTASQNSTQQAPTTSGTTGTGTGTTTKP